MRLVRGADGDDAIEAVRVSFGEGESDHSAVGRTNERVETRDADLVEHACDRVGLVGVVTVRAGSPSARRPPSRKSTPRTRNAFVSMARPGPTMASHHPWRRIVLGRSDVARRRNPAEDRDDWRVGRADDLESRQVVTRIRKRSVLKTWCFLKQRHLHVPRDTLAEKKKPPVLI